MVGKLNAKNATLQKKLESLKTKRINNDENDEDQIFQE
jgi:hypothetical protein